MLVIGKILVHLYIVEGIYSLWEYDTENQINAENWENKDVGNAENFQWD